MTVKEQFSDEHWKRILETPLLAGFVVSAADPGGLIGAFQESAAIEKSLQSSAAVGGEGTLEHAIAEAFKTTEGRSAARDGVRSVVKGKRSAEALEAAVARLVDTVEIVESVAPERAAILRNFIIRTAVATAEAAKEGGILGIGGEQVSDAERKSLEELKVALGLAGF